MLAACKGHLNDLKIYSAVDEICTDQAGLHGALETNQEREKAKTYFQKKIRRDTFYRASLKTYS